MTKPDAINWGNLNESDTAYFRTAGAPMSTALANNGYAGSDIPDNQDHNTLFRNAYLWEQYLLNRQQANEPTLLYSSGTATWDGSALVLSANLDMSFRIGTGVQINRIAAGTLTFGTDGHVLVLKKDSTTASPVTITSGTYGALTAGKYAIIAGSSLTATDQENELLIFRRNGTNLEIPAIGLVYPTGSTITFGGTNLLAISGTLPAANGGTGQSSYAVGDLLYASGATALSKLADVATGNALISGGVTTAPAWGKVGLTTHVSGTLPVANGGTGSTAAQGSGDVVLSISPTINSPTFTTGWTGPGSSGQNSSGELTLPAIDPPSANKANRNSFLKSHGYFSSGPGTNYSYNCSISKITTGTFTITLNTPYTSSTSYSALATVSGSTTCIVGLVEILSASSYNVRTKVTTTAALHDDDFFTSSQGTQ